MLVRRFEPQGRRFTHFPYYSCWRAGCNRLGIDKPTQDADTPPVDQPLTAKLKSDESHSSLPEGRVQQVRCRQTCVQRMSCHKHHFCRDKHNFVANFFCRDKHTFVVTNVFVATKHVFCRDIYNYKYLSRQKTCLVVTNTRV